jgi:hypothetical protein
MTPNIAIVHIDYPHRPRIRLWLPLFLLWIPSIVLTPVALIVLFIVCVVSHIPFGRSVAALWNLLCSLPGTDVRVSTEGNKVFVRIL